MGARGFNQIVRPFRAILSVLVAVNVLVLFTMLVLLSADIVVRYVSHSSIYWLHETSSIVFPALYMLGTVEVYARRRDVDLDVVGNVLAGGAFHAFAALRHVILAAAFLLLAWFSWELIGNMEGDTTPLLRLPSYLFQYPVVVSGVLIAGYSLLDALAHVVAVTTGSRPETIDGGGEDF